MNAYSIDDIRRELIEYGDFTRNEVERMTVDELISAWLELPRYI